MAAVRPLTSSLTPSTTPLPPRSEEAKSMVKGLLERRVANRLGCGPQGALEIKVSQAVQWVVKSSRRKEGGMAWMVGWLDRCTIPSSPPPPPPPWLPCSVLSYSCCDSGTPTSRATTGRSCWPRATRPSSCPRAAASPSTSTTLTSEGVKEREGRSHLISPHVSCLPSPVCVRRRPH